MRTRSTGCGLIIVAALVAVPAGDTWAMGREVKKAKSKPAVTQRTTVAIVSSPAPVQGEAPTIGRCSVFPSDNP